MRHPYPKNRAARVDRAAMTEEEWKLHRKKVQKRSSKKYNDRNPGLTNGKLRNRRATFPWYQSLCGARSRAKKKGLTFDLTPEWAVARYTGFCELTYFPFIISAARDAGISGGKPYSVSIDRKDPSLGYTQDNCRFVIFAVNSFKGTMTDEEMLTIAKALILH